MPVVFPALSVKFVVFMDIQSLQIAQLLPVDRFVRERLHVKFLPAASASSTKLHPL
jgi:hypothetical protein